MSPPETAESGSGARLRWPTSALILAWAIPAMAAFELGGGSARAAAVGGAFTAVAGDVDAIWFNAAANGRVQHLQAGTTHALLYPGLKGTLSLNAASASIPVGGGSAQVGLSTLDYPGWHEQIAALGYGKALHPRVAVGTVVRSSSWRTDGLSNRSWSVDLGGTYEVGWIHPKAYLRLGAVVSNLSGANISAGGYAAGETPRGARIGAALDAGPQTISIDAERRGGSTTVHLGYETRALSLGGATFRLGANSLLTSRTGGEVDVGIGHGWKQWHMDYAYAYPLALTGLGGMHRISLAYHAL